MTSSEKHREADCVTTKEIRDVAPAHYVLHFKSFSLFAKNNMEKYESSEFEAGGCKWKLILYPNGDKSRNGEDHISVYLAVSGTSPFQLGGEIHVAARFSLYDQLCDRYLTEQVRAARLHALKAECGVPRFMPLKIFADPSNGYLVDDTCVFGVEVFVIKSSGVGERLTLKESTSYTHEWKISGLSKLGDEYLVSDVFTLGDHEW
ncbi:ubiquitin C-terminal hydrolase 12-like [Rhodamnia argentea]|uniref:Ubiquitin C-terminal hydrolase 12-like n=1 Tax=Rhodamnia argentea TaxID=178133 RepID=A0ABM3HQZ1_9MYRT|nr:ubiquitin C-terminal hydrolase 12-like [Rhodamnia argentea]